MMAFIQTTAWFMVLAIPLTAALAPGIGLVSSDAPRETGSEVVIVPLRKQYAPVVRNNITVAFKTAYSGELSAGLPSQPFTVVFDTGSAHLVVPDVACSSETCSQKNLYNRRNSKMAIEVDRSGVPIAPGKPPKSMTITFGIGEVEGEYVRDLVCLGPRLSECVGLQLVSAMDMTADPFSLFEFDGVLGMGLAELALEPRFSLFGQLIAQHPGLSPQFSVFLARNDEGQSAITLGGYKPAWAADPFDHLSWTPVADSDLGYWQVQLKQVWMGDVPLSHCADGSCRAILDTGFSLLGVPKVSVKVMTATMERPPIEGCRDCRDVPGPDLSFELEGIDGPFIVRLEAEDYTRPRAVNYTMPGTEEGWRVRCRPGLYPVDMGDPFPPNIFLFGEPMLRKWYTVYDWDLKRIGFTRAGSSGDAIVQPVRKPPKGFLAAGVPLGLKGSSSEVCKQNGGH